MFININNDFETVVYEVWLGEQLIERQQVQAPEEMLKLMFMNYVQELACHKEPMHLRMSGTVKIWDQLEGKFKVLPKSIDYWNYNYQEE